MSMPPILSIMIFLPLVCAFMVMLIRGEKGDEAIVEKNVKHLTFFSTLFVFIFAFFLFKYFDPSVKGMQFEEKAEWLKAVGLNYHLGVDGISIFFILLSAFLMPICVLASWNSVHLRVKEYMIAFLVLESFMIGTFCALDSFLFYVFFEAVLIPMYLIIGIWGGKRRIYASYKFFLYTLLGSVLMLVAVMVMSVKAQSTDMTVMAAYAFDPSLQKWLWLAFFASFAVKMPMWPVHTWLPDAHVEAPTAGSVILAGVLLKMGGYGFLRFSLPMLPDASIYFAPMVLWMSVIAIIYTSLIALVQEDMKKLIAYSSVAHMGFVTLGIFSFTQQGIDGALFQMISHGVISAALFLCVGVVYDRLHTREIGRYGGIVKNMPNYALVFMIFMLGSVGLPGTSGFVGEFLALLGAFRANTMVAFVATTGVVLGAAYMLVLYRRVVFGPVEHKDAGAMKDLNSLEKAIFLPLVVLVFYLGINPIVVTEKWAVPVSEIVKKYDDKAAELIKAEGEDTPNVLESAVDPASKTQNALEKTVGKKPEAEKKDE